MPTRPTAETSANALIGRARRALTEARAALGELEDAVARQGGAPSGEHVGGLAAAALGAVDAAAYLGIGRTSLLALPIPSVRIERRRLWRRADLDAWLAGLPSVPLNGGKAEVL